MAPYTLIPVLLAFTSTMAQSIIPTAAPTVTGIWVPESIPLRPFPQGLKARVFEPDSNDTEWKLDSPRETWNGGEIEGNILDWNYYADMTLRYSGEGLTVLKMAHTGAGIGEGSVTDLGPTKTQTETRIVFFLSGECTSTSGASDAKCTGSYGATGGVYTSVSPSGKRVTISTISSVTPFPTAPRVTAVSVTVTTVLTSSKTGGGASIKTSSSSGGGAPRQTQGGVAVLGAAAVLGGVAAMAV